MTVRSIGQEVSGPEQENMPFVEASVSFVAGP
jgi:hypothetical protein